ncbi:MAG: hypothetical protein IKS51_09145 [Erysipelotrichaceae bacterium]|nr:hypothetical protein [Erysipelotrichaceae bacterium]
MKKKKDIWTILLLTAAIAFFLFVSCRTLTGIQRLSEDYHFLMDYDLSQDMNGQIYYADGLYGEIGYGIEIIADDPQMAETLRDYLHSSLRFIDRRILSCGLLYSMLTSVMIAYGLYRRYGSDPLKHTFSIVLSFLGIYAAYLLFVWILHLLFKVPFYPTLSLTFVAGILSVIAGHCALGILFRFFRFRKILSLAAIPLVLASFILGFLFEHGLYCEPYQESFSYLADIDPRVLEEDFDGIYYDEEKNVMVLEGIEYASEQVEDPDHLKGLPRVGAYLYEMLNPYAGNSLFFYEEAEGTKLPEYVPLLYVAKAILWIIASLKIRPRRQA